jgi:hypothetical protein
LSMGFGYRKGPLIWDFGFAFRNGTWLHTMKGFNLSSGITLTSFGGWKTDKEKSSSDKGLRGFFNRMKKKRSNKGKESTEKSTSSPSEEE